MIDSTSNTKMLVWCSILCCILLAQATTTTGQPVVNTTYGQLRGEEKTTDQDEIFQSFLGIPYAAPPIGELRWRRPEPPEAWDGIRDAVEFGNHCFQLSNYSHSHNNFSEDCLFLNVIVPGRLSDIGENKVPVMFFIHGGAFLLGSGATYPAQELALHGGVVVVTINYRLGVLGFMSTGDEYSPGNSGLWDMKMALDWVQDNIGYFGGDSERVTIFGQSAGGAAVSHLIVSPEAEGLFQNAISISGTASAYIGRTHPHHAVQSAEVLADLMFCPWENRTEMMECMREADPLDLYLSSLLIVPIVGHPPNWVPTVDPAIVPRDPRESWRMGAGRDVNYISSRVHHDGVFIVYLGDKYSNDTLNVAESNITMDLLISTVMGVYEDPEGAEAIMRAEYPDLDSDELTPRTIALTEMLTDWWFGAPSVYEAAQQAKVGNSWVYDYEYNPSFYVRPSWVKGRHSDDQYAFFGEVHRKQERDERDLEFSAEDRQMTNVVMSYFTNFAHTGNPNTGPNEVEVEWTQYDEENTYYLRLGDEVEVVQENQDIKDRYHFWNEVWFNVTSIDDGTGQTNFPGTLLGEVGELWTKIIMADEDEVDFTSVE